MGKVILFPHGREDTEIYRMELMHRITSAALELSTIDLFHLEQVVEAVEDQAAAARRWRFDAVRSKVSTP